MMAPKLRAETCRHLKWNKIPTILVVFWFINPSNAELSPICHLLALLAAHHILHVSRIRVKGHFNPSNAEISPICHLLALLEAHHIFHVSRKRVKTYSLFVHLSLFVFLVTFTVKSLAALCTCWTMSGNNIAELQRRRICLEDSWQLLNLRRDAISFHFGRSPVVLGSSLPVVCDSLNRPCLCQSGVSSVYCYMLATLAVFGIHFTFSLFQNSFLKPHIHWAQIVVLIIEKDYYYYYYYCITYCYFT